MKRTLRGSYTVEAAVLMPLILFSVVYIIQLGLTMYRQLEMEFQDRDKVCETEAVKTVYHLELAENIWEELEWR